MELVSHNDGVLVTIPYYKCKFGIRKAVASILSQSHKNLILLVINDGDPEPPWSQLKGINDPRLVRFNLERNEGRYFADAIAIEAIDLPYFLVQDSDDWSEPERISTLLARLKQDNALAAISTVMEYIEVDGELHPYALATSPNLNNPHTAKYENRGPHCGVFNMQILKSLGGYYGGFRYGYDRYLINLLTMIGFISCVEKPLYNRLLRHESLSHSPETGMSSFARKKVHQKLEWAYLENLHACRQKKSGQIDLNQQISMAHQIRNCLIKASDEERFVQESKKLRQHLDQAGFAKLVQPTVTSKTLPGHGKQLKSGLMANAYASSVWEDDSLSWTHWNISRWAANQLMIRLSQAKPARILELGTGISTLFLASFAAENFSQLICLEHKRDFFEETKRLLGRFALTEHADLRLAELVTTAESTFGYKCYGNIPKIGYDFVFIDGPPQTEGREGALFAIVPFLNRGGEIWLHDANREHEQDCIRRWRNYFHFDLQKLDEDRGIYILTKISTLNSA